MKAVLVIDMPETCGECVMRHSTVSWGYAWADVCRLNWKEHTGEGRPSWCPLKPLPKKRDVENAGTNYGEEPWFSDGWNACIEEIEK